MGEEPVNNGKLTGSEATQFKPGNDAGGRRKGSKNKTGHEVVDDIVAAYRELGGVEYLLKIAKKDFKTFCRLLERVMPKNIELTGDLTISADKYILDLMRRRREAKNAKAD